MDKKIKKIKKLGMRARKNSNFCLFSANANTEVLMEFCNILSNKIDEIIDVVNQMEENDG